MSEKTVINTGTIIGSAIGDGAVVNNYFEAQKEKVLFQLPSELSDFIGRKSYLEETLQYISEHEQSDSIIHISGMAGVGKSALAIKIANKVKNLYPDA